MRLHGVLKRALPGLAAAVVTLSVAAGPALAQTNPFQPKAGTTSSGGSTTATTAASSTASAATATAPAGIGSTAGSSAATTSAGASAATAGSASAMPTTGMQAARFAAIGFVCLALGVMLVLAARPRRPAVARSPWDLAPVRIR